MTRTHTHSQLQLHKIPNSAICHRGFISQARCVFLKARTVVYAIPCGDESNRRFALQIRLRIYFSFRIQMSFLREVRLAFVTCVATCSGAAPKHFATVACAERLIVDSFVDASTFGRIICMCVSVCVCCGLRALLDGRSRCQKWSKSPWPSAGR